MQFKGENISLVAGLLIFVIITALGLNSEVGVGAILLRAAGATFVIGILIFGLIEYMKKYLLPSLQEPENTEQNEQIGVQLDLTVGQEEDISELLKSTPEDETNEQETIDENQQFKPFTPQQINPNLQTILKENPQQAAEVIRKMGLDK